MKTYCLEIIGEFACFTRPEMKVERVSYDVITPASARSIFEAILWKPAIRWRVTRIEVLNEIKWISLRRNELGSTASIRSAGLYIEDDGLRQQRAGLFLRDVAYRIYGRFEMVSGYEEGNSYPKFLEMFERRAEKGQCFNQPYLGCREFAADFKLVDPEKERATPIDESRSLGWMLYDMDYQKSSDPTPRFFNAQMEKGVINIPDWNSVEVRA